MQNAKKTSLRLLVSLPTLETNTQKSCVRSEAASMNFYSFLGGMCVPDYRNPGKGHWK